MDRIQITGIEATGFHGVFDFEKREGQPFVVDVTLSFEASVMDGAAVTDELTQTVDYGVVAGTVVGHITGQAFDLIETLAVRIAEDLLADPKVSAVEVTVHKPKAPIAVPFGDVAVVVSRSRT